MWGAPETGRKSKKMFMMDIHRADFNIDFVLRLLWVSGDQNGLYVRVRVNSYILTTFVF